MCIKHPTSILITSHILFVLSPSFTRVSLPSLGLPISSMEITKWQHPAQDYSRVTPPLQYERRFCESFWDWKVMVLMVLLIGPFHFACDEVNATTPRVRMCQKTIRDVLLVLNGLNCKLPSSMSLTFLLEILKLWNLVFLNKWLINDFYSNK